MSLPPHRDLPAVAPLDNISEPVSRAGSKTPAPSPYESDPRAVTGERRRPPPAAGFPASAPAASPSASGPHLPSRFLGSAADARPVCRNPDARATAPRSAGSGHTCGNSTKRGPRGRANFGGRDPAGAAPLRPHSGRAPPGTRTRTRTPESRPRTRSAGPRPRRAERGPPPTRGPGRSRAGAALAARPAAGPPARPDARAVTDAATSAQV